MPAFVPPKDILQALSMEQRQRELLNRRRHPSFGQKHQKALLFTYEIEIGTEMPDDSARARDIHITARAVNSVEAVRFALEYIKDKLRRGETLHYIHVGPRGKIEANES